MDNSLKFNKKKLLRENGGFKWTKKNEEEGFILKFHFPEYPKPKRLQSDYYKEILKEILKTLKAAKEDIFVSMIHVLTQGELKE